jgi:hypothetical protein
MLYPIHFSTILYCPDKSVCLLSALVNYDSLFGARHLRKDMTSSRRMNFSAFVHKSSFFNKKNTTMFFIVYLTLENLDAFLEKRGVKN